MNHLSKALKALGHQVEVVSGPPAPQLDEKINLFQLPGLDLYNPADPFRMPSLKELSDPVNLMEWLGVSTMGFPEPFTFGIRAYRFLKKRTYKYDIVHDNQSISYGIRSINRVCSNHCHNSSSDYGGPGPGRKSGFVVLGKD